MYLFVKMYHPLINMILSLVVFYFTSQCVRKQLSR